MPNNNLLSIIVPNYNNAKYIEECINSILEQTYKNIEIIIIDDASTDHSKEILQRYETDYPFIKVIYNEQNKGVTNNRDIAIAASAGKFITTLDSDDYYLDNQKLEKEMTLIKNFHDKGQYNIIPFSNIVLVDTTGEKLFPNAKSSIKEGNIFKNIFARTCMIPRDFIMTKEQYNLVGGFDTEIPIYEDWDLKIRLSKNNAFYYSKIDGIAYRRHGEGLSSANPEKHMKWLKAIYKKNYNLINRKDRKIIQEGLNHFFENAFNCHLHNNFIYQFKKIINKGIK